MVYQDEKTVVLEKCVEHIEFLAQYTISISISQINQNVDL